MWLVCDSSAFPAAALAPLFPAVMLLSVLPGPFAWRKPGDLCSVNWLDN